MNNPIELEKLINKNVTVYFNLHKKLWSIKSKGRVIGHVKHVTIEPTKFHVNEKQRLKVIEKKCRQVHAWINGKLISYGDFSSHRNLKRPISFNPYKCDSFYWIELDGKITPISDEKIGYLYFNGNTKKCYSLQNQ